MRHTLVKILSFFVKKEKRQNFRIKFDPIERNKALIKQTRVDVANIRSFNPLDLYYRIFALENTHAIELSYKYAFDKGIVNSYDEHLKNIENLKSNLSQEALLNLEKILSNLEKSSNFTHRIPELWLQDEDDIEMYSKKLELQKQISRVTSKDGVQYYQYKHYKLPVNFFQASLFLYHNGMHKLKTLASMKEDEVIIDAGYCIGDSALVMRDFTQNKIIGFEPTKENCESAKLTVQLNNLKNIECECMGLGDKNEELAFSLEPSQAYDVGAIGIVEDGKNKCQITTLDDYVKKHNLKIGLIKSDVEGYEQKLLAGAIETIKTQKPRLLISIYHNYNDFYKIKPWIESLDLGYSFNFYHGLRSNAAIETLLIAEVLNEKSS